MESLNDFFDGIYCINLDRRKDRWEQCEKIFKKHNLTVNRVKATDWKDFVRFDNNLGDKYKANIANLMSVIKVFNLAYGNNVKRALLLEDDVEFVDNLTEQFFENIKYLPKDWGFLYLGGNHEGGYTNIVFEGGEVSPLIKCNRTYALQSFGFTNKVAPIVWRELSDKLVKITNSPNLKIRDVVCADYWIGQMQEQIPTYSFTKPLSWQRNDYSDIEQQKSNYEFLKYNI